MKIEFDPGKDTINTAKHGVSLSDARNFEWDTAIVWLDTRRDYKEPRKSALGYIGMRLFFMAFVEREDVLRIISLRKANSREVNRYAEA